MENKQEIEPRKSLAQAPMTIRELSNRLHYVREKHQINSRQLSLALDMKDGYYSRLESGKYETAPTFETFFKILQICGFSCEEFFHPNIEQYESDKELLQLIKDAPESRKKLAIQLLKTKKD